MQPPKLEVVSSSGDKNPSSGGKNPVYSSVKRCALDGLSDLLRVMLENVDDAMFERSDKVDNDRERTMFFEAMREIRLKRDSLKNHFDHAMRQRFDDFITDIPSARDTDDMGELTLLELSDLEDNIAIEAMISRARPYFEDDLFAVTERLKLVLEREEIDADRNPLDPKSICDCFHEASELLEAEIEVKLIFYKLFEKHVMNNLGHLYQELNDIFVKKGVLPDFKPDQERMKQTTRFMSNRIRQNLNNTGITAALAAAPDDGMAGGVGSYVAGDGNLFAALQQAAIAPGIGYAPGANPAGIAGQAGMPAPGGGVGGGVVGAAQSGSFVAALTNLQNTNIPTEPSTAVDPQSFRAEIQQQLTHFIQQNQGQFNAADGQTIDVISMLFDFFFDDDALPAPIKVLIGRLQIPMLKVAIIDKDFFNKKKHPARKLLDSISSAALGWSDNHADQQALIEKTEEVVGFLINEFDQDIGVFEEAYINFENFLAEENAEIEKAEQMLLQQEQENDQQIQQAQEAAAELIEKLTAKRELSFAVTDFLETTWTSVLFKAYLSLGESSNHWKNLKRISTTFVWTLVPKFSEVDRVKIIKTIPVLLRALSKGMDLIKINSAVQNRIFLMLALEHSKIVKQTAKNIGTGIVDQAVVRPGENGAGAQVDDQAARTKDADAESLAQALAIDPAEEPDFNISADTTGEIQIVDIEVDDDSIATIDAAETIDVLNDLNEFTTGVKDGEIQVDEEIVLASDDGDILDLLEQEDGFLEQAQALEIGNWVEFTEANTKAMLARLSWKSNVTGNFVFVNRQGHKVKNMSLNGMAIELRAGRVKRIESVSVFDRAIDTIMTRMRH